jgi:hypothetical protein
MISAPKIYFVLYIILVAELLMVITDRDAAEDGFIKYYQSDSTRFELSFIDDIDTITWVNRVEKGYIPKHELITKGFLSEIERENIDLQLSISPSKDTNVKQKLKLNEQVELSGILFTLKKVLPKSNERNNSQSEADSLLNKKTSTNFVLEGRPLGKNIDPVFNCYASFSIKGGRKLDPNLPENVKTILDNYLKNILQNNNSKSYAFKIIFKGGSIVEDNKGGGN